MRANLWIARSGRWRGPYTVKNRRHATGSLYRCQNVWQSSSPARLVAAYGLIGFDTSSVSANGTFGLFPYTLELDANANLRTPASAAAASRFVVPSRFTC